MVLGSTVTEVITGKMRKDAEAAAKKIADADDKKKENWIEKIII